MTELERALVALGHELDVPPLPDLAPGVLSQLAPLRAERGHRRLVLALAAVAAAALLAVLAIPEARSALLRFLGVGAVRIELVEELPPVAPPYAELELTLGERVSLADARRRARSPLLELEQRPDAVYLGERGTVWFLYGDPDRVRLLVAQTPELAVDEPFILKKLVEAGTAVAAVDVRGRRGYFLSGEPHFVLLLADDGRAFEESARLARDVLVWDEDGRTIRIEGELEEQDAIALAEKLRVRSRE